MPHRAESGRTRPWRCGCNPRVAWVGSLDRWTTSHAMRQKFINLFGILLLFLLAICVGGAVTGAVIPLFGGIRAERIGAMALGIAAADETVLIVVECFVEWAGRRPPEHRIGFSGPKRYGNKKHVI